MFIFDVDVVVQLDDNRIACMLVDECGSKERPESI